MRRVVLGIRDVRGIVNERARDGWEVCDGCVYVVVVLCWGFLYVLSICTHVIVGE